MEHDQAKLPYETLESGGIKVFLTSINVKEMLYNYIIVFVTFYKSSLDKS